jgi:hypothetical protein
MASVYPDISSVSIGGPKEGIAVVDICELEHPKEDSKADKPQQSDTSPSDEDPLETIKSDIKIHLEKLEQIKIHTDTPYVKQAADWLQEKLKDYKIQPIDEANLNTPDNANDTTSESCETMPLHNAAKNGDEAEVDRLLLQADADPNATDQHGHTPLHKAAKHGHKAIVTKLLRKGADPHIKDNDRYTPRNLAYVFFEDAIAELLRQHEKPFVAWG